MGNHGRRIELGQVPLVLNLLLFMMLWVGGCSAPRIEGSQVEKVPAGFLFDVNASAARLVLPRREMLDQRGYGTLGLDDEHCSIMITEYSGITTYEAALAAYQAVKEKYPHNHRYGPIEPLFIDKQPGWGWLETQIVKGEVSSLEYVAIISHEEEGVTYSVEFYASENRYMDEAFMKETIQTFSVKHGGVSYGRIGIAVAIFSALGVAVRKIGPR